MDVISQIDHLDEIVRGNKKSLKTSGFVPTMGALHTGHFSLIKQSVAENDISFCSIFVNPLQFNNPHDLKKYPRDLEKDLDQLKSHKCDFVFTPDTNEFYKNKPQIKIDFGNLGKVLEGQFRPGHFNGVAIVVSRLLHMVQPDRAYFGLKDLQQYYVVRQLCMDLGIKSEIVPCEIIREADGLAMSSRNRRLNEKEREVAPLIFKCLQKIKFSIEKGASFQKSKKELNALDLAGNSIELEYLEIVSLPEFELNPELIEGKKYALCIAAMLSGIRLIDNIRFEL